MNRLVAALLIMIAASTMAFAAPRDVAASEPHVIAFSEEFPDAEVLVSGQTVTYRNGAPFATLTVACTTTECALDNYLVPVSVADTFSEIETLRSNDVVTEFMDKNRDGTVGLTIYSDGAKYAFRIQSADNSKILQATYNTADSAITTEELEGAAPTTDGGQPPLGTIMGIDAVLVALGALALVLAIAAAFIFMGKKKAAAKAGESGMSETFTPEAPSMPSEEPPTPVMDSSPAPSDNTMSMITGESAETEETKSNLLSMLEEEKPAQAAPAPAPEPEPVKPAPKAKELTDPALAKYEEQMARSKRTITEREAEGKNTFRLNLLLTKQDLALNELKAALSAGNSAAADSAKKKLDEIATKLETA